MDTQQQLLLGFAVKTVALLVTLVGAWALSRWAPRGSALVVASALYAVGYFLAPSRRPDLFPGLSGILCMMGFVGMTLGVIGLIRHQRAMVSLAGNGEGTVPNPASESSDASGKSFSLPGPWAAVSWCLVFVVIVQIMPMSVADVVGSPDTRSSVFRSFIESGPFVTPDGRRVTVTHVGANRGSSPYLATLAACVAGAYALIIGIGWLLIKGDFGAGWRRVVGLRWPSATHLMTSVVGALALWILAEGIYSLVQSGLTTILGLDTLRHLGLERVVRPGTFAFLSSKWSSPVAFLLLVAAPAVAQEMWFRAYIGRGLVGRFGTIAGVLATSGLCAVAQLNGRQAILAFVMSIALHLAYLSTRSLLVPIVIHMVIALATLLMSRLPSEMQALPLGGYIGSVILVIIAGVVLYRTRLKEDVARAD